MRSERPRVANAKAKDLGNVIRRQHRQLKASESARVEAQEQVRELSERVRALEAKLGEQRSRPARREPVRHALAEVPAADDHLEDGIREAARRRSLRDIERRLGRIGWEAYTATR